MDVTCVGGVDIRFGQTYCVPDYTELNVLPNIVGWYPMVSLSSIHPTFLPAGMWGKEGLILPVFRKEALCMNLVSNHRDCAVAVGVSVGGRVNAISGDTVPSAKQDYILLPPETGARLDGFASGPGVVQQFVAMALDAQTTLKEQVFGTEGGLYIDVLLQQPSGGSWLLLDRSWELGDLFTPQELGFLDGSRLIFQIADPSKSIFSEDWTPGRYARRVSRCATLNAGYSSQIPRVQEMGRAKARPASPFSYLVPAVLLLYPTVPHVPQILLDCLDSLMAPDWYGMDTEASSPVPRQKMFDEPKIVSLAAGGLQETDGTESSTAWFALKHIPPNGILGVATGGRIYVAHIHALLHINNWRQYSEARTEHLTAHIVLPEVYKRMTSCPPPLARISCKAYLQNKMQ
ncbi:hypothetical protein DFH08DRAFT_946708 [Mycena albidolilacea]|uniref:Uncharacterized protein n=1 Tax=Mycena albidolilacea TaxID=1033008 RepID=A0AAD7AUC6_9AGAR|nr:hypothetical protein DFH08DRAFT_946708 [Mycena albidolilacea]